MAYFGKQIYKKEDASLKKTVFLDRDGTLINEVDYLSNSSQIHLLPGITEGIKKLNAENSVLIVVTNQPVIARGLATIKDVKLMNNILVKMLNRKHAYINAIYFCPHHPETSHPDIPPSAIKYRIDCECRKPKLAMLRKAVEDFSVNLEKQGRVFIIGDTPRDIKTGENLGVITILVQRDYRGKDNVDGIKPDYVVSDFNDAVDIICKR